MAKAAKAAPVGKGEAAMPQPGIAYKRLRSAPFKIFVWCVALPAMLVYGGMCTLMVFTLTMMSGEINRVDADRGQKAVAAALDSFLASLGDSASDEAAWNEAYLNTYVVFDPAWLDSTWGSTARIGSNYDNVVVTDNLGAILFGENQSGSTSGNIADKFGGTKGMLAELDEAIAASDDGAVVSHFARDNDGVTALAAAVIHRTTIGGKPVRAGDRRILWLARHITSAVLKDMAFRFQIPPPVLTEAVDPNRQHVMIKDAAGATLGNLAWEPSRPGDSAFFHAASIGLAALVVSGGAIAALLWVIGRAAVRQGRVAAENWHVARFDSSTGLLNRFGLVEQLKTALAANEEPLPPVALTYLGFADSAGYSTVDHEEMARALARLLVAHAPAGAFLARLSSDEFALGVAASDAESAARSAADAIVAAGRTPINVGADTAQLKLHVGTKQVDTGVNRIEELLRLAEQAMHGAQARSADTQQPAVSPELRQRRLELATEIRRALDKDEFDLDYQPIFDFGRQTMLGVEALLRWKRRPGGALGPLDIMDAALSSGLADELGILMLRRAAREIGPFPQILLCVNVASEQFRNPNLAEQIQGTLAASRFPANRLQLEITESLLHHHPEVATASIGELRAQGISIALDDFGAGHTSLSHLHRFGIDRVKLDRAIVGGIDADPSKFALAQGIMTVAKSVGLKVTAEGVERREEAATLTGLGCTEFQGYLFARPMPLEALIRLVQPAAAAERKAG